MSRFARENPEMDADAIDDHFRTIGDVVRDRRRNEMFRDDGHTAVCASRQKERGMRLQYGPQFPEGKVMCLYCREVVTDPLWVPKDQRPEGGDSDE